MSHVRDRRQGPKPKWRFDYPGAPRSTGQSEPTTRARLTTVTAVFSCPVTPQARAATVLSPAFSPVKPGSVTR